MVTVEPKRPKLKLFGKPAPGAAGSPQTAETGKGANSPNGRVMRLLIACRGGKAKQERELKTMSTPQIEFENGFILDLLDENGCKVNSWLFDNLDKARDYRESIIKDIKLSIFTLQISWSETIECEKSYSRRLRLRSEP